VRWLILSHRYLGIGFSALMAMWCLSGIVMVFVGYPALPAETRIHHLPALDWSSCCTLDNRALGAHESVRRFELEMLEQHPILRVVVGSGEARLIDLTDGKVLGLVTAPQAVGVAERFAFPRVSTPGAAAVRIDYDQWTVAGNFEIERPLYRVSLGDPDGTEVYVSSRTGRAVQVTTARQRFWNWFGAIPHWLYFAPLRHNARVWPHIVVYSSLCGCLLALSGLYLGSRAWLLSPNTISRYHGLLRWHHITGLFFGLFLFTWIASGFLSMNPWGWLEGSGAEMEEALLQGASFDSAQVRQALRSLAAAAPAEVRSVQSSAILGHLFEIAFARGGDRVRIDSGARAAPLADEEIAQVAELLAPAAERTVERLDQGDTYYFSHFDDPVRLPVYRIWSAKQSALYYLDAVSGQLIAKIDRSNRIYRWLHGALHRLDFVDVLRAGVQRGFLMVLLLMGTVAASVAGLILALRRTSH
jgi:uncharacterized iron-regulated membrane protein